MDTWERIARGVKKELAKDHWLDLDSKKKIGRLYRTTYFTGRRKRGPLPFPPYEGKEEILVDGNEHTVMVKRLGLAYYELNKAVKDTFDKLGIGWLANKSYDEIEKTVYSWFID